MTPLEAAARAGDREDSAQRGEPCAWTHPDLKAEDDPVFVRERLAVYAVAILAFLDAVDEEDLRDAMTDIWGNDDANARAVIARLKEIASAAR